MTEEHIIHPIFDYQARLPPIIFFLKHRRLEVSVPLSLAISYDCLFRIRNSLEYLLQALFIRHSEKVEVLLHLCRRWVSMQESKRLLFSILLPDSAAAPLDIYSSTFQFLSNSRLDENLEFFISLGSLLKVIMQENFSEKSHLICNPLADELPKLYISKILISSIPLKNLFASHQTHINLNLKTFHEETSRYHWLIALLTEFEASRILFLFSEILFHSRIIQLMSDMMIESIYTLPFRGQYLVYEKFPIKIQTRHSWLFSDKIKLEVPSISHEYFIFSDLCSCSLFISPNHFETYLLFPSSNLNFFFHYIWRLKSNYKSSCIYPFEISGVRIFFEDEQEISDFRVSFSFEEILGVALDFVRVFLSELADINRLLISIQLKEKLQPELFITKLDWNIASFLSPELFTAYLNLKSQFEQARVLLGGKQAVFHTSYQQTSVKAYSIQLDFNFLIDVLMDVWINVFEYVDAYLKAPWVIILSS